MQFLLKPFSFVLFCIFSFCTVSLTNADTSIEEIIVSSDFRGASAKKSPQSLTIVTNDSIKNRAADHLENILNLAPNVNYSSGASRGRFFQIRGVGERSQFKEPLNSSVGLIIDGIDFSNLGLAGALYDVEQVEILRGPQGTNYGSNAMGGMVNIKTYAPTEEFSGKINFGAGNYDSFSQGLVLNGRLSETVIGRLSLSHNSSDGFVFNDFLNQDNTNNIDETSGRLRLLWTPFDDLSFDFSAIRLIADNGYDVFSLTHNRTTSSDQPGQDYQLSEALSLKVIWDKFDRFSLESQLTDESSDLAYGFDWDWSNTEAVGVRGVENNSRKRNGQGLDLRFLSNEGYEIFGGASWVAGVHYYDREVSLSYTDSYEYYGGPKDSSINSVYNTNRHAAYGQLDWLFDDKLTVSLGMRAEHFENNYINIENIALPGKLVGEVSDDLFGGKLSLKYQYDNNTMLYGLISYGYKTGGINADAYQKAAALKGEEPETLSIVKNNLIFGDEALVNYEFGLKGLYFDDALALNLSSFYIDRRNMQAKLALEISTGNWTEYTNNADGSYNYGLELDFTWQIRSKLQLFGALGLLKTKFGELYAYDDVNKVSVNQEGREHAHSPSYQYNMGVNYNFDEHLKLNIQLDGKDSFYFSTSHNQLSKSYQLLHAKLSYDQDLTSYSLWARNIANTEYETRGFYFANNPNNGWITESYTQLGEPRMIGISVEGRF